MELKEKMSTGPEGRYCALTPGWEVCAISMGVKQRQSKTFAQIFSAVSPEGQLRHADLFRCCANQGKSMLLEELGKFSIRHIKFTR